MKNFALSVKQFIFVHCLGEMTERPKVHAWKACVRHQRTEGSNPSLSAE